MGTARDVMVPVCDIGKRFPGWVGGEPVCGLADLDTDITWTARGG